MNETSDITVSAESAGLDHDSADGQTDPARRRDEKHPILQVRDLRKRFGGVPAADGVSLEIAPETMTGLIGPNGAGKSTTFNLITGVYKPDGGTVTFKGKDITGLRPDQIVHHGLVRSFQIARELRGMTVLENVMLAPRGQVGEHLYRSVLPGYRRGVMEQEERLREQAWETLEFFEIDHLATEYAGNLSGGQRKLLELARVMMVEPEMVLLDEPLAGVNPTLERKLLDRLHELRERGLTFLLVEHDMNVVMNNCDPVIVMHQGKVLVEGSPDTIMNDDRVLEAYLGGELER